MNTFRHKDKRHPSGYEIREYRTWLHHPILRVEFGWGALMAQLDSGHWMPCGSYVLLPDGRFFPREVQHHSLGAGWGRRYLRELHENPPGKDSFVDQLVDFVDQGYANFFLDAMNGMSLEQSRRGPPRIKNPAEAGFELKH